MSSSHYWEVTLITNAEKALSHYGPNYFTNHSRKFHYKKDGEELVNKLAEIDVKAFLMPSHWGRSPIGWI